MRVLLSKSAKAHTETQKYPKHVIIVLALITQ